VRDRDWQLASLLYCSPTLGPPEGPRREKNRTKPHNKTNLNQKRKKDDKKRNDGGRSLSGVRRRRTHGSTERAGPAALACQCGSFRARAGTPLTECHSLSGASAGPTPSDSVDALGGTHCPGPLLSGLQYASCQASPLRDHRSLLGSSESAGTLLTRSEMAGLTEWGGRVDGDMHEASRRNSDGTHHWHVMIGEPTQRATVSFSRRTGGDRDVDSKTTAYWRLQRTQQHTKADHTGQQAEP
jgi:hypothetical protein